MICKTRKRLNNNWFFLCFIKRIRLSCSKSKHFYFSHPYKGLRISESRRILLVESGIRNAAQWIRNPTNDWNPESKFHWLKLESSISNPDSTTSNPEFKTSLEFLTWMVSKFASQNAKNDISLWVKGITLCYKKMFYCYFRAKCARARVYFKPHIFCIL